MAKKWMWEVSSEVRANFAAWFEHNFLDQGAGRIGVRTYARAGEMDDVCAGRMPGDRAVWYHDAYERGLLDRTESLRLDECAFLLRNPLVGLQLALGITDLRGLRCYRRGLAYEINRLQQRAYRTRYYARDNARRRRLAAERRAIRRRTTLAPCPTPEAFLAAWEARNASDEARVRFGGLVHDLECHVDNCLRIVAGVIVGRNGGIKAWIAANLPQLSGKYKTIMRFKALAKRLRQATEIPDPIPTSAVFDGLPPNPIATGSLSFGVANKNYYAVKSQNGVVRMSPGDIRRRLERARTIMRDARREGLGVRRERTDAIREKLGVGGEVGGAGRGEVGGVGRGEVGGVGYWEVGGVGRGEVGGTFAALWAAVERHLE